MAGPSRTKAQLRKALLTLTDVPAGFELISGGKDDGAKASSSSAKCAPLVRLLNQKTMPGSLARATVSFSGGEDGPALDQTLDAAKSAAAAAGSIASYRNAVKNCDAVTYSVSRGRQVDPAPPWHLVRRHG